MENEKERRVCKTCKYFTQHYRKLPDGSFRSTACGFCGNDLASLTKRKRLPSNSAPCQYWSSLNVLTGEQIRQENIKQIKDALSGLERMMVKLDHLVDEDIF